MQVEIAFWREYKIVINLQCVIDMEIFPFVDFIELPLKSLIIILMIYYNKCIEIKSYDIGKLNASRNRVWQRI
jgi:hypothetical protein